MKIPSCIELAYLPTRIENLTRFSNKANKNVFIKRDDTTGMEFSGNKVRKLEFVVKEAIDNGCDTLITCGGIQSNHCRATAAVAAKLGLKSCVVLRSDDPNIKEDGNYFLDKVLGAKVRIITPEEYKYKRQEIMEEIKKEYDSRGSKAYIIPEGASSGIGTFGYFKCMQEIVEQEKVLGVEFDTVVTAIGSGGTYAGLLLANKVFNLNKKIIGICVCDDEETFKNRVVEIIKESNEYLDIDVCVDKDEINIIDGYVGRGYALSREEEIEFIQSFAKEEGVIVDPVYTGKSLYGLSEELNKGSLEGSENILFIHTGGLYGLFPSRDLFRF